VRADRCAFDVAVTGDEQWAFPYQTAERLLDDGETVLVEPSAPGRPGEPTLVVAGEIGGLALPLHAALTAPEGTILMARVTSCPASGAFRVNVGPRAPADALGSTIDLCGTDELLLLGQHDEFFPNEGYVWIPSDGTYDITISGRSNEPESSIEVAFYIDPTPTVVTGTGS